MKIQKIEKNKQNIKSLPLGMQTFSTIIESDYIYLDKTSYIYDLIREDHGVYFLSRPRRFGKSLLIDTIKEIFECKKELFKNLWIYDKWNWDDKYNVIRIDFSSIKPKDTDQFISSINTIINQIASKNNINLIENIYYERFQELIQKLHEK